MGKYVIVYFLKFNNGIKGFDCENITAFVIIKVRVAYIWKKKEITDIITDHILKIGGNKKL